MCLHILREYSFYTTSAGLHLSLCELLLGFFCGGCSYWSVITKALTLFLLQERIYCSLAFQECLVSSLPDRRSVLKSTHHPTATLSLIKHEVSYLHPPALLLKLPSDTLDNFHFSIYYKGEHPLKVWCASEMYLRWSHITNHTNQTNAVIWLRSWAPRRPNPD